MLSVQMFGFNEDKNLIVCVYICNESFHAFLNSQHALLPQSGAEPHMGPVFVLKINCVNY